MFRGGVGGEAFDDFDEVVLGIEVLGAAVGQKGVDEGVVRAGFEASAAQPRGPADKLFQGRDAIFQRHRRGPQPEDQSVHEKSLWLPQLRFAANFPLSHTWRSTRTQVHPQILLKSLNYQFCSKNHLIDIPACGDAWLIRGGIQVGKHHVA